MSSMFSSSMTSTSAMTMGGANAPAYSPFAPACLYDLPSADPSRIDGLLDLSDDAPLTTTAADVHHHLLPVQPDGVSTLLSSSFADDIYIPEEEAAELEWLSKFVEDSFSAAPYPPASIPNKLCSNAQDIATPSAAGRGARSKRPRARSASNRPSQQQQQQTSSSSASTTSSPDFGSSRPKRSVGGADNGVGVDGSGGVRRCAHCASEKTPQWRAGPLGPKTLCNACGVRYKSGRLVPEYRPAASPSFVLAQHSNSHRKVVELRRQKEARQQQQQHLLHRSPTPRLG